MWQKQPLKAHVRGPGKSGFQAESRVRGKKWKDSTELGRMSGDREGAGSQDDFLVSAGQ